VLIDTHAHLDLAQFDADRAAVLARARAAGVATVVTVGIDLASSRRAVRLAAENKAVVASVGVHPHDASTLSGETLGELRTLSEQPGVVAVGEIGLDYYRDRSPRDVQRRAFQAQLAWAARLGKPVIIHDRDAHADVLRILSDWAGGLAGGTLAGRLGVLHTFSGDLAMAERAMALGFYIGFSGPVTYQNARQLPRVMQGVPLDRIVVETDCPFLPPHPHRGTRNEPSYVRLVAERVAEIKGVSFDELAAATTANARWLFQLDDRALNGNTELESR
jgi:TatD DNase family protein